MITGSKKSHVYLNMGFFLLIYFEIITQQYAVKLTAGFAHNY